MAYFFGTNHNDLRSPATPAPANQWSVLYNFGICSLSLAVAHSSQNKATVVAVNFRGRKELCNFLHYVFNFFRLLLNNGILNDDYKVRF